MTRFSFSNRRHRNRLAVVLLAVAGLLVGLVVANPASAEPPPWPTVQNGYSGTQVTTVQYLLRHHGQDIEADGSFGSLTEGAVKAFQTANDLGSDGIVGPQTWAKLVVEVKEGDNNEAVKALQTQLKRHGSDVPIDGQFSAAITTALKEFQKTHEIPENGVADAVTWQTLVGSSSGNGTYVLPLPHDVLPRGEYDDPHHDYPAIDLPVNEGTDAYAAASGKAIVIDDDLCGRGVNIEADDGSIYTYCHFSEWNVSDGQQVSPGDLIGLTGNTGNSTGPHLHFGIRIGSTRYCPQNFLLALYDGENPPIAPDLPTSGCSY